MSLTSEHLSFHQAPPPARVVEIPAQGLKQTFIVVVRWSIWGLSYLGVRRGLKAVRRITSGLISLEDNRLQMRRGNGPAKQHLICCNI